MMRKHVFGAIVMILCLISLGAASARGQGLLGSPEWLEVGSIGDCYNWVQPYSYTATYFFGPLNGVAAVSIKDTDTTTGVITIHGFIYYLSPNQQTMGFWILANLPAGIVNIRNIRLIHGKLYAASQGTDVLISTDSGRTWAYSGLGLVDANDVYADGSGAIRALHDPMKVFARLDTMHCIAQGTGNIFVSSDGGLNWISSGVPMVDSFSTGAFADRCQNVYVCPNSWGTAWRSTDLGQNWESVLTGSGTGSEFLNGASISVYLTDTLGLFRSTDDGLTWYSVITVNSGPHVPLFVFGPMGEHVVMPLVVPVDSPSLCPLHSMLDVLMMTTTGGLDDLHSGINMTDSNGRLLMQQDTMNIPWELASTCQPFKIPIAFWADVDGLSEKVTLSDSLSDFALMGEDSVTLPKHKEDTLWMQYDPHHPVSNVVLTFENHWHCSDWTETRTVHVDAFPAATIDPPPQFAASCIPDTEAALIRFDSCDVLCIDSVSFPPSIAANLHVASALPDTTGIGHSDSLLFAFNSAGMSGTVTDSIIIYGHYLGMDSLLDDYFYFPHASGVDTDFSFFYTTVPVTLHPLGTGTILSTTDSSLNVGARYLCEASDTFAVIKNHGCDTACIDTVTLSGIGFAIASGSGAMCLAPGERDTIWLEAGADTTGHTLLNLDTLEVASDANPPLPPILLSREIEYPTPWELSLSPAQAATAGTQVTYRVLQSGSLPTGVSALDFTLTYNDDLLSFIQNNPSVTYSRTPDGLAHLHFHLSPVPADSILGSIVFTAFVARDTQTALSLEDIMLANSQNVTSNCLASITTSQSSFTLLPQCGTPELTNFLKTKLIQIESIDPNPATDKITITVYSDTNALIAGELSIVDAIGRNVLAEHISLSPGKNHLQQNVSELPDGFYAIRLNSSGCVSSKEFVKE